MNVLKDNILVTGAAGFIGAALVKKLLMNDFNVIGVDNLNDYYSKKLKYDRLKNIDLIKKNFSNKWLFYKVDIAEKNSLKEVFEKFNPRVVVNLAAQAGVRYSISNPDSYIDSNMIGFFNLLECCRKYKTENLIYASSSSVYGSNSKLPFSEDQEVNHPMSLYAASKRSNELMAHAYSNLFKIPTIGLRFFTVYGPWGRPDMAPMLFADAIYNHRAIDIFNYGNMMRDFTFIDDVVESIYRCCLKPAKANDKFNSKYPTPSSSFAPYMIFNVGNTKPINLIKFVEIIEEELGLKAIKNFKGIQQGDVVSTSADITKLEDWVGFNPKITINEGIALFIKWFKDYYFNK